MASVKYGKQKTSKILMACCLCVLVVINAILTINIIAQSSYVQCSAKIISVGTDNKENYITLSYNYENKDYIIKQTVSPNQSYNKGDNIEIKINPDNPVKTANYSELNSILIIDIAFAGIVLVLLAVSFLKKRKYKSENRN